MYKQILVPLDGSKVSESALETAHQLGRSPGVCVHFLVATHLGQVLFGDRQETLPTNFQALREQQYRAAQVYLQEVEGRFREAGIQSQSHILQEDPRDAIPGLARKLQAELIVMASAGKSNWMRWLSGSITEQVLRNSSCPVLVVRPKN